jgi:serine/threonine-protein kinase
MRIPGLGCLKGCVFMVIVLFVGSWLIWELTPLQDWIGTSKGFFSELVTGYRSVRDFVQGIGGMTGN